MNYTQLDRAMRGQLTPVEVINGRSSIISRKAKLLRKLRDHEPHTLTTVLMREYAQELTELANWSAAYMLYSINGEWRFGK